MKGAQRPCNFHDKGQDRLKRLLVFFIHILHLHLFINSMHQHCKALFVKELNFFCGSFRRKFPPLSILLGSLRTAGSPNFFILCILRFPPKAIPATYSFSCGSLRSRFPPLLHPPRPEGQTNVPLNRQARSAQRIGAEFA